MVTSYNIHYSYFDWFTDSTKTSFIHRFPQRKIRGYSLTIILIADNSFLVIVWLQEMKSVKAKYRPPPHGDQVQYKPAVGRDTNSGPLVATKDYLTTLEQNLLGLANHLEQSMRRNQFRENSSLV